MQLLIIDSSFIPGQQPLGCPFAAWLHFGRPWNDEDRNLVSELIDDGCNLIFATGASHEEIHELIDDIVIDRTEDLVLTSSAEEVDEESAFEFLSTECPSASCKARIVLTVADDIHQELKSLAMIIAALDQAKANCP